MTDGSESDWVESQSKVGKFLTDIWISTALNMKIRVSRLFYLGR